VPVKVEITNSNGAATIAELQPNSYYTAQIKKQGYQVSCATFYIGNNKD